MEPIQPVGDRLTQQDGPETTALYPSVVRPLIWLSLFGAACLAAAGTCIYSAMYGGKEDQEGWRFLTGFAAAMVVLAGLATLGAARVWRRRGLPYLVLSGEGMRSPGFVGLVPWTDIRLIEIPWLLSGMDVTLHPSATLPARTGQIRRVQPNPGRHAVHFPSLRPRGLSVSMLRTEMDRYSRMAHNHRADEMTEWRFDDPPDVAVVTTRRIVHDGAWVAHVSHDADDGGWQFHDSAPVAPSAEDAMVVALGSMVRRDATLHELADLPQGWRAWRACPSAPWQRGKVP